MRTRLSRIALVAVSSILVLGCGDGSSEFATESVQVPATSSASAPAPFTSRSYTLGELNGTLASVLVASLQQKEPFTTQTSDGPVIVADDIFNNQGTEVLDALVKAYADGRPVVMVQPDTAEVNALRLALGLAESYTLPTGLPEGKEYAEVVAFDREESGDVFTLEIYPSVESGPEEIDFFWADNSSAQQERVEILLNWLREDLARPSTASDGDTQLSSKDLQALAQAQVDSKVFTHRGAIYQVTHYIYACHSFTDPNSLDSDWFYIQQGCQNNYSGGYSKVEDIPISGGKRAGAGLYGGTFKTDSWIENQDNGNQNVLLATNSPRQPTTLLPLPVG